MTQEQWNSLKIGDIVRHKARSEAVVIVRADFDENQRADFDENQKQVFHAVRIYTVSNPDEWKIVGR